MSKIKIHEIAKKLNLTSKEVIEIANKMNIEAKSHLSGVTDEEAERIEKNMNNKSNVKSNNVKIEKETKQTTNKEDRQPVIIRREVIINQDKQEENVEKQKIKEQNNRNDIGFVQRKQNNDYKIVERKPHNDYSNINRNKPNKPMTVSELFGLQQKAATPNKQVVEEVKEVKEVKTELAEVNVVKPVETTIIKNEETIKNTDNTKKENNYRNNNQNGQYNNNIGYRNNNQNGQYNNNNGYRNNNQNGQYNNNNGYRNNNQNGQYNNNNGYRNNNQNGQYNNNGRFGRRQNDEKSIDKDIKNIVNLDNLEKENVREYANKVIDKQKNHKLEEIRENRKSKSKKSFNGNDYDEEKLKSLKQTDRLSNMFSDQDGGMLDFYDLSSSRGRKNKKKNQKNMTGKTKQKIFKLTEISIPESITVKNLALEMKKTSAEVIKKLLGFGIMATINNDIDFDTAFLLAQEFGITATKKQVLSEEDILFDDSDDHEDDLMIRPPVIVVMGHVDHGKTSLLDVIRKTNVIEGEAGGITQAIGAYKVKIHDREITFLDTPGHEAFTSMRARGAQITDIAILVVAANDGVKPQTIEAINHAKSAGLPIIVAINKIDLPDSNIEKVKQELMAYELVPEEWGGDTIYVPISAKQNENIDQLLEMVLLQADVLELKANPNKQSKGAVIEARLDKSKGAIATMLVQRGTLDLGDTIVVGSSIGRIRDMRDDKGKKVKKAGPSTPVEIMGLTEVPQAGDVFYEVKNEKMAKHLIERRKHQQREKEINAGTKITLDNLFSQMEEGNLKVLNLILKADVQGSVEAVKQSLEKMRNEEVKVKVIHSGAGAVNQSDVTLAKVSNAIIIAFNVRPDATAREMAEKEEIEIKQYSVIYQAIEDVEAAMKGMLEPKFEEKVIGNVEVRQTFKISNVGTIAGAYVLSGKVERNAGVRVIRENVVIHDGKLCTLKRFKDDVKEVTKGFECGIQIEGYNDIKEMDIIEVYIMEEIKRK